MDAYRIAYDGRPFYGSCWSAPIGAGVQNTGGTVLGRTHRSHRSAVSQDHVPGRLPGRCAPLWNAGLDDATASGELVAAALVAVLGVLRVATRQWYRREL